MAQILKYFALALLVHSISCIEENSEDMNEVGTASKVMQTARQFGDLLDGDIALPILLLVALGIPLLGLLSLGAVLLSSGFVYRYAFSGLGTGVNALSNIGTGTGITTASVTGRRKRSVQENSRLANGLSYIQKMLDNAQQNYS